MHALGEALTRAGRTAEGRTRLEEAERLRARAVELQRRLRTAGMLALEAELHRTNGEHDRAIEAWQQVLALEGRSAAAHMRLADVLVAAKRLDEAAAQLVMAIAANGGAEAHRRLALVYAAMGRPTRARASGASTPKSASRNCESGRCGPPSGGLQPPTRGQPEASVGASDQTPGELLARGPRRRPRLVVFHLSLALPALIVGPTEPLAAHGSMWTVVGAQSPEPKG